MLALNGAFSGSRAPVAPDAVSLDSTLGPRATPDVFSLEEALSGRDIR